MYRHICYDCGRKWSNNTHYCRCSCGSTMVDNQYINTKTGKAEINNQFPSGSNYPRSE